MALNRTAEMNKIILQAIDKTDFNVVRKAIESKAININDPVDSKQNILDLLLKKCKKIDDAASLFAIYLLKNGAIPSITHNEHKYADKPTACNELNKLLQLHHGYRKEKFQIHYDLTESKIQRDEGCISEACLALAIYYDKTLHDKEEAGIWYKQISTCPNDNIVKFTEDLSTYWSQEAALECLNTRLKIQRKSLTSGMIRYSYNAYDMLIFKASSRYILKAVNDSRKEFFERCVEDFELYGRQAWRVADPCYLINLDLDNKKWKTQITPSTAIQMQLQIDKMTDSKKDRLQNEIYELQRSCEKHGSFEENLISYTLRNRHCVMGDEYTKGIESLFGIKSPKEIAALEAKNHFQLVIQSSKEPTKIAYARLRVATSSIMYAAEVKNTEIQELEKTAAVEQYRIILDGNHYHQLDHFARAEMANQLLELIDAATAEKESLLNILFAQCKAEIELPEPCGMLLQELLANVRKNKFLEHKENSEIIESKLLNLVKTTHIKYLFEIALSELLTTATTEKQVHFMAAQLFEGEHPLYIQLDNAFRGAIYRVFLASNIQKNFPEIYKEIRFQLYQLDIQLKSHNRDADNPCFLNVLELKVFEEPTRWEQAFLTTTSLIESNKNPHLRDIYFSQIEKLADEATKEPQLRAKAQEYLFEQYSKNAAKQEKAAELGDPKALLALKRKLVRNAKDDTEVIQHYSEVVTEALKRKYFVVALQALNELMLVKQRYRHSKSDIAIHTAIEKSILSPYENISPASALEVLDLTVKLYDKDILPQSVKQKMIESLKVYFEQNLEFLRLFKGYSDYEAKYKSLFNECNAILNDAPINLFNLVRRTRFMNSCWSVYSATKEKLVAILVNDQRFDAFNVFFVNFPTENHVREYAIFEELINEAKNTVLARLRKKDKSLPEIQALIDIYNDYRKWSMKSFEVLSIENSLIDLSKEMAIHKNAALPDLESSIAELMNQAACTYNPQIRMTAQTALNESCAHLYQKHPAIAARAEYPPAIAQLVEMFTKKKLGLRVKDSHRKTLTLCAALLMFDKKKIQQHYGLHFADMHYFDAQCINAENYLKEYKGKKWKQYADLLRDRVAASKGVVGPSLHPVANLLPSLMGVNKETCNDALRKALNLRKDPAQYTRYLHILPEYAKPITQEQKETPFTTVHASSVTAAEGSTLGSVYPGFELKQEAAPVAFARHKDIDERDPDSVNALLDQASLDALDEMKMDPTPAVSYKRKEGEASAPDLELEVEDAIARSFLKRAVNTPPGGIADDEKKAEGQALQSLPDPAKSATPLQTELKAVSSQDAIFPVQAAPHYLADEYRKYAAYALPPANPVSKNESESSPPKSAVDAVARISQPEVEGTPSAPELQIEGALSVSKEEQDRVKNVPAAEPSAASMPATPSLQVAVSLLAASPPVAVLPSDALAKTPEGFTQTTDEPETEEPGNAEYERKNTPFSAIPIRSQQTMFPSVNAAYSPAPMEQKRPTGSIAFNFPIPGGSISVNGTGNAAALLNILDILTQTLLSQTTQQSEQSVAAQLPNGHPGFFQSASSSLPTPGAHNVTAASPDAKAMP